MPSASSERMDLNGSNSAELTPVYIYPAHISSIKCVAVQPGSRHLATGSTDEHIPHRPQGCCEIPCHPSVWTNAADCGDDRYLKLWDLTKANCCAYTLRVKDGPAEKVVWSPSGDHYAILSARGTVIRVYGTHDGSEVCTVSGHGRFNDITMSTVKLNEGEETESVVAGGENGSIGVWGIQKGELLARWNSGHNARIKGLDYASVLPASGVEIAQRTPILVTCSSAGGVRVWDLDATIAQVRSITSSEDFSTTTLKDPSQPALVKNAALPSATPVGQYDAACRLTCITVTGTVPVKSNRHKFGASVNAEPDDEVATQQKGKQTFRNPKGNNYYLRRETACKRDA
ncbi:WD40-repeat-containing domain protein [Chytridium lagenaria]|nr:WD40-repeat-containing domain protein [Chytridium lagenaria]